MKRTLLVVPLALCIAAPALASAMKLATADPPIFLQVDIKGSVCNTTQNKDGSWEASCAHGSDEVHASSVDGCLDSTGMGYCGTAKPPHPAPSVNQLSCPGGVSYYLTSGVQAENDCTTKLGEQWKRCESSDKENYAEASCKAGCGDAGGAGVCCMGGKDDCPFGYPVPEPSTE